MHISLRVRCLMFSAVSSILPKACYFIHQKAFEGRKTHQLTNSATLPHTRLPLCVDVGVSGVLLDKLAAWLHVVAHKHGENLIGIGGILDGHLFKQAR